MNPYETPRSVEPRIRNPQRQPRIGWRGIIVFLALNGIVQAGMYFYQARERVRKQQDEIMQQAQQQLQQQGPTPFPETP